MSVSAYSSSGHVTASSMCSTSASWSFSMAVSLPWCHCVDPSSHPGGAPYVHLQLIGGSPRVDLDVESEDPESTVIEQWT